MKRTKITDVAKLAGVSPSTVSNVLNGRYGAMTFETRKQVEAAVKALRYTPNISARRLSAKDMSGVVCIVIPTNISNFFDSTYYPVVLSVVGDMAASLDVTLLIYTRSGLRPREETDYLLSMYGSMVGGFLFFDLKQGDDYFLRFRDRGIPYICVGSISGRDDYSFVASDHEGGLARAVESLAAYGYRKIQLVSDVGNGVVSRARQVGYDRSMQSLGLHPEPLLLEEGVRAHTERARAIFGEKLAENPPEALIVSCAYARDILDACRDLGTNVPGDLTLLLFDCPDPLPAFYRPFSRLENISGRVAQRAFTLLLEQIEAEEPRKRQELLPVSVVPGEAP
jgi:LacI family kdg operon repressor